jgi:hypothetical protein
MAGRWKGTVRDESEKREVTLERYGPMFQQVRVLIDLADFLDEERMIIMGDAYKARGSDDARYAWRAARERDRVQATGNASWDVKQSVEVNAFGYERASMLFCSNAAADAGIAVATRDLIGVAWYGQSDYDRLVAPWKEIFPESV